MAPGAELPGQVALALTQDAVPEYGNPHVRLPILSRPMGTQPSPLAASSWDISSNFKRKSPYRPQLTPHELRHRNSLRVTLTPRTSQQCPPTTSPLTPSGNQPLSSVSHMLEYQFVPMTTGPLYPTASTKSSRLNTQRYSVMNPRATTVLAPANTLVPS